MIKEDRLQIIVASYDGGYQEGMMIGRRIVYDVRPTEFIFRIENGNVEQAYRELRKILQKLYMREAPYYSIICVIDACIFTLKLSSDAGKVYYEYINYKGEVSTGRFPA